MHASYELEQTREYLKILKVFHYVYAGFTALGILFVVFHYMMMSTFMKFPEVEGSESSEAVTPGLEFDAFMDVFVWFYVLMALFILGVAAVNLISARFMAKRKNKIFSIVIAALNCAYFPIGTTLGVFTILVLLKPVTNVLYHGEPRPEIPPR